MEIPGLSFVVTFDIPGVSISSQWLRSVLSGLKSRYIQCLRSLCAACEDSPGPFNIDSTVCLPSLIILSSERGFWGLIQLHAAFHGFLGHAGKVQPARER